MAHFIYFRVIDRDNDGFVSVVELTDFLTRLGDKMPEEEVTEMIRIVDKNDRGVLSCKGTAPVNKTCAFIQRLLEALKNNLEIKVR